MCLNGVLLTFVTFGMLTGSLAFVDRTNWSRRRLEEFDGSWGRKLDLDWRGRLRSRLPWSQQWRGERSRRGGGQ
jgi:hypothetical protein